MKIAFPTIEDKGENSQLADHFGRAPYFTIYHEEENKFNAVANTGEHFGGGMSTPALVEQSGAKVLICKGLGRKAVALFNQLNIKVYITEKPVIKEVLEDYMNDKLTLCSEDEACSGHH